MKIHHEGAKSHHGGVKLHHGERNYIMRSEIERKYIMGEIALWGVKLHYGE